MKSWPESTNPVVSICCTAYNHEKYINDAIDGFLMQETTFPFEIIIRDDFSSDNTASIIKKYAGKYSNIIKPIYEKENLYSKGVKAMPAVFEKAVGKYLALCEGDDYWIDSLKLQKQVDFLEENETYNICFHKVQVLFHNNFINDDEIEKRFDRINHSDISSVDLLEQGNFIHTPSVVFRNTKSKLPFEFNYTPVGDYFLHIINSQSGYIKRLEDKMAVYRRGVGIFSTLNPPEMTEKMLAYQVCILSYLDDNKSKEILLNRHLNVLYCYSKDLKKQFTSQSYLVNDVPISTVLSVLLLKFKKTMLRWIRK